MGLFDFIKTNQNSAIPADIEVTVSAQEVDDLMDGAEQAHQQEVDRLNARIAELEHELTDSQNLYTEAHADLQASEGRVAELEAEVTRLGNAAAEERAELEPEADASGQDTDERFLTEADKAARAAHERKEKRLKRSKS